MKFIAGLFVVVIGINASVSAQNTVKLSTAKANDYGIVYSLPRTHLDIQILAKRTTRKAGPFCQYAKKYLSTDDAIMEDNQDIEIEKVIITPYGEPEDTVKYLVQFKKSSPVTMVLSEEGLPLGINADVVGYDSRLPEIKVPASIKSAYDANVLSGELLRSESTSKRAEIAANRIYEIRENRNAYNNPDEVDEMPDGQALKIIMDNMARDEQSLLALFNGTTRTDYFSTTIDYEPNKEVKDAILVRLSDATGFVEKEDLSGEPLYITTKVVQKGEMPVDAKGNIKELPKNAVVYNIPGEVEVVLSFSGKNVFSGKYLVAQQGIKYGLDPNMFTDKKEPCYVTFYPETGAIRAQGLMKAKEDSDDKAQTENAESE